MSICRHCGEEVTEHRGRRSCRNGCSIYTAQPIGDEYWIPSSIEQDKNGCLRVQRPTTGSIRREPTCRE